MVWNSVPSAPPQLKPAVAQTSSLGYRSSRSARATPSWPPPRVSSVTALALDVRSARLYEPMAISWLPACAEVAAPATSVSAMSARILGLRIEEVDGQEAGEDG